MWTRLNSFACLNLLILLTILAPNTFVAAEDSSNSRPAMGLQTGLCGRFQPDWGLIVERVDPASPAAKIGVQPGDVILEINRIPLRSQGQYYRLLHQLPGRAQVTIEQRATGRVVEQTLVWKTKASPDEVQVTRQ